MTVIDLIIRLQQLDPNKTVVLDATKDNAKVFHFLEVANADEVVTPDNQLLILLTPFEYEEPQNEN